MASRKVNTEGIDEELLIASIGKKRNEEQMPPPVQRQAAQEEESNAPARRDASGKKKQQDDDYIGLYLGRNEIKTRQCVYISRDVHSVILKIVNSIAPEDTTVGGYIDTVLRFHLQQHKDRINELYKKQRDNLI
ncbi:DUF3408 domain-containing protein [Prevotella copri]|uniref:DUF3408 domain-containing protein n=1 Tax=Segatella copri TaxID=165179 RepID=A0A646HHF6_9BACT|nr:DUF3408 domain-containing protein [Segatella copri]MQN89406.1 DUF3408 domain-containing protein [Segatella copri]MQO77520.1 DUF3408 domain-containing protein [Segatella copri]